MAITLWRQRSPFEGLSRWFDDVDTWFDRGFFAEVPDKLWRPAIDVEEKDGKYMVRADLPGLNKEDIHIELHDGYLTLRGERKSEQKEKKGNYRRVERTYGTFERTLSVPEGVTDKDIHAHYADGVLELTIPAPKAAEPKAVEIKID
jgi:HSP20 family protein